MGILRKLARNIRGTAGGVPSTPLKYSDYADGVAYVLTAITAYSGFIQQDPTLAYYFGLAAAGFYAISNWLAKKGD